MKYLKHYYVQADDNSAFVFYTNVPPMGKVLPNISGLDVVAISKDSFGIDYCYSTCNDDADLSTYTAPGLFSITYEQWITEIQESFVTMKTDKIRRAYGFAANNKRHLVEEWFLLTEVAVFAHKKYEAEMALSAADDASADLAAPNLKIEASARGITTKALAQKVITNFNSYMEFESKVSGARGKAVDEISLITLDTSSLDAIKNSFGAITNYDFVAKFQELDIFSQE